MQLDTPSYNKPQCVKLTSTGAWCPLLVGELQVQLFFTHLPDEHLEQATDHEQCIVGLPDKQLTVEEAQNKNITSFEAKQRTATEIQAF